MNKSHTICKPGNLLQPISIVIHLASLIKENNNACHFFREWSIIRPLQKAYHFGLYAIKI